MSSPATMLYEAKGSFVVFVNLDEPISDAEWVRYVSELEARGDELGEIRLLIIPGNAAPSAKQRKRASECARGLRLRAAIVSDALIVRSIVTALGWFGVNIRAFDAAHTPDAYAFLSLSEGEIAWAGTQVAAMRHTLLSAKTKRST
jgi:hypothetical protein